MKKFLLAFSLLMLVLCQSVALANNAKIIDRVNNPADVKKLSIEQLDLLAKDVREGILNRANLTGGPLSAELGMVEATIALHYVFDSPIDKFVFDTSHQIYTHKMLTGRKKGFSDPLHSNIGITSNQHESKHDFFILGHTSTSLSLAGGMAKARDLKGEKYNIVAIIGDGSLSGGEALEGLSTGATLNSNFIIVVNDNDIAIAPVNDGLYAGLTDLRLTNGKSDKNIFKIMGYDYYYLDNGNNIADLIEIFKQVKDTPKPTVVHIHTIKGKGYEPAEKDPEKYHVIAPHTLDNNGASSKPKPETYMSVTADYLLAKKKKDNRIIAITPATPDVFAFTPELRKQMGKNYMDVDIAEQNALGYIAGLATNGAKPILGVKGSYIQRGYDQIAEDIAINNAPATILVFVEGISNWDAAHCGTFDIPLISNIPNIVYLAPTSKEEYLAMLDWSVEQNKYPVAIRVPYRPTVSTGKKDTTDYSKLNKYKLTHKGEKIAIIGAGNFYRLALETKEEIKKQLGFDATVINPVYLTGIDEDLLNKLKANHNVVITLEDGCLDGGFGEKIARFYGNSDMRVLNYGAMKEFTHYVPVQESLQKYHLTKEQITEDVKQLIK